MTKAKKVDKKEKVKKVETLKLHGHVIKGHKEGNVFVSEDGCTYTL